MKLTTATIKTLAIITAAEFRRNLGELTSDVEIGNLLAESWFPIDDDTIHSDDIDEGSLEELGDEIVEFWGQLSEEKIEEEVEALWGGRGTYRVIVELDGDLLAWDSVAGHYTRHHNLSA